MTWIWDVPFTTDSCRGDSEILLLLPRPPLHLIKATSSNSSAKLLLRPKAAIHPVLEECFPHRSQAPIPTLIPPDEADITKAEAAVAGHGRGPPSARTIHEDALAAAAASETARIRSQTSQRLSRSASGAVGDSATNTSASSTLRAHSM